MTMGGAWECPKCQTLNAFGDQCYSCGAPRPSTPAQPVAPDASAWEPAAVLAPAPAPMQPPALAPTEAAVSTPEVSTDEDTEPHPCWCHLVNGPHDTRDHPA